MPLMRSGKRLRAKTEKAGWFSKYVSKPHRPSEIQPIFFLQQKIIGSSCYFGVLKGNFPSHENFIPFLKTIYIS